MPSFLDNSSLYRLPSLKVQAILHQEPIKAQCLFLLFLDVDVQPEFVEMLNKICAALKLNTSKVEYLCFKEGLSLNDVQQTYQAENMVVFGAETNLLNIQAILQNYRVYPFEQFNLLLANDIIDLYANQQMKAKLWKSLQEMIK